MGKEGILDSWRGPLLWAALGGLLLASLAISGRAGAETAASFDARGSVEQVYATGLVPGAQVSLYDSGGGEVARKSANGLGGILFRNVAPGDGYRVGLASAGPE
ncbi:MAG: hypothetical protein ACRDLL_10345, partial [Solirubrobacterales bacterium]